MISEKRRDYMAIYKTDKNLVIEEGDYQNERLWIPYFHDLYLTGKYDSLMENNKENTKIVTFEVNEEDLKHFPELKNRKKIKLYLTNGKVEEI